MPTLDAALQHDIQLWSITLTLVQHWANKYMALLNGSGREMVEFVFE